MRFTALITAGLLMPTFVQAAIDDPLNGADFVVNCLSDKNGGSVTLARSGETDKGFIVAENIKGEAQIIPGLNSLTFLHIMDQNVVTFVVDFDNLHYDMSVKGPHAANDSGYCSNPAG